MKIKLEIEIENIQDWDVDWNDDKVKKYELGLLKNQIRGLLCSGNLLNYNDVSITKCNLE